MEAGVPDHVVPVLHILAGMGTGGSLSLRRRPALAALARAHHGSCVRSPVELEGGGLTDVEFALC